MAACSVLLLLTVPLFGVLKGWTNLGFVCSHETSKKIIMAQHGANRSWFTYVAVFIPLLISFFAILQFTSFSNSNSASTNFDGWESHLSKDARASQRDQYLLGVGKADITG